MILIILTFSPLMEDLGISHIQAADMKDDASWY